MIKIYKYIFYGQSYFYKKYDDIWEVEDAYWIGGAITIGGLVAVKLVILYDLIGIFFIRDLLANRIIYTYLPAVCVFFSLIYFGRKKRHIAIYEEMRTLPKKTKIKYRILSVLTLVLTFGTLFSLSDYIRVHINGIPI